MKNHDNWQSITGIIISVILVKEALVEFYILNDANANKINFRLTFDMIA